MTIGLLVAWLFLGLMDPSWIGAGTKAPTTTTVADDAKAMDGGDQPPPPRP